MIKIFWSQVWLNAKVNQGGLNLAEFFAYRICISLLMLILYCLIAYYAQGQVDLTRWVVGNAFILCIFESIHSVGSCFNEERSFGRLKTIIVSPTSKLIVIMYRGVSSILISFLTISIALFIGGKIFDVQFSEVNLGMLVVAMLISSFAAVGLGSLLAVFALITDSMYLMLNSVVMLIMIFSGANFPVTQLPDFAQWISKIFPLNRGIAAANMSFSYDFNLEFWQLIREEALLGLTFYLLAFFAIRIVERIAIRNASLEMF